MSKSSFAMIVLAAISTSLLLMPDSATARAGGVSRGSHGTASGGTRGAVVRSWHGRSGHLGRHRAFRSGQGRWGSGVIGVAVDPASYGYGPYHNVFAARHCRRGDRMTIARMSLIVKVFGCRPLANVRRTPAAGVRKPPREETAVGGRRRCGALWRIERDTKIRSEAIFNGCQPRIRAQLGRYGTILLNGESNFLAVCDFKGLHVAKRAHWTTSAL